MEISGIRARFENDKRTKLCFKKPITDLYTIVSFTTIGSLYV